MKANEEKRFAQDVKNTGRYLYYSERLSSRLSNARTKRGIAETVDLQGKSVVDVGCGDGNMTLNLFELGVSQCHGFDPVDEAVCAARERCVNMNVSFEVCAIDDFNPKNKFDCAAFLGVLHHMEDPEKAIFMSRKWTSSVLILEPNGYNPALKLLEKFSEYHVAHGERSFTLTKINHWLNNAGYTIIKRNYINMVPLFCPDWFAKICKFFEPIIEKTPIIKNICCGQIVIYAERHDLLG